MRPTARQQSALRTPLNDILATEASVRILRALTQAHPPISSGELARRTLLQRSSVHRTLRVLERTGLVSFVGTGPRFQVELRTAHPLAQALEALFTNESARAEAILSGMQKAAGALVPPPIAVWIEGPFVTGVDKDGDAVQVRVLDNAPTLARTSEALQSGLEEIERQLDVTVEVRGMTPADLAATPLGEREQLSGALPLVGVPPLAFAERMRVRPGTQRVQSHADLDARAIAIGRAVADKLARDPALIEKARAQIARRLPNASPAERRVLGEWDRLLRTTSPVRLRQFLTDQGQRATRLRQSLPFIGMLTPAEREAATAAASSALPDGLEGKRRGAGTPRTRRRR